MTLPPRTRFAPSPTGYLHLGHAFAALAAARAADRLGGEMLLRIEDIDQSRCKPEFEAAIYEDLGWLGLHWPLPVRRQSDHFADYAAALQRLDEAGLIYPCFCTRADIRREIAQSPSAPQGPDGPIYPGICRSLNPQEAASRRANGEAFALRLDTVKARTAASPDLFFEDETRGRIAAQPEKFGDVVLARKDTPTSYHLAVTVDDHRQAITLVTRGEDLLEATHVHRLLQDLLGYTPPRYAHHRLLTNPDGKRYAKREGAVTLRALRDAGETLEQVIARLQPLA
ncbi:MAG: tRNA glutamyl-Q(34) synthetase GluQRS [Alphaproteobacteria bacterium]|nr:tRNA glutamyl-Q(34) synthetase GluQRS [Alphaproteobacteria bacterium]